jgi:hypothetical protein
MKESIKNKIQAIYSMVFSNKGVPAKPRFLPNYFRKIGFVIILLWIIFRLMPLYHTLNENFKILFGDALIVGLFFVVIAKEKIEDELAETIRLKAMVYAFSFAVFFFIFQHINSLTWGLPIREINGPDFLVFFLAGSYSIIYFGSSQKRK